MTGFANVCYLYSRLKLINPLSAIKFGQRREASELLAGLHDDRVNIKFVIFEL